MEYAQFKHIGAIDTPLEMLSFVIALVTNISSIILFLVSAVWWWKLRQSKITDFGNWFLGTAFVMAGLWVWSITGMIQIWLLDMTLPTVSLPARCIIMVGVLFKIVVATRCRPMPHSELSRFKMGQP